MAAVIVETGTGSATADAYVTTVEVGAYVEDFISAADKALWDAETEQDRRVREATQYLDAVFGPRWLGCRANETQALDWPRSGVVDPDGYSLLSTAMPVELKRACAYVAYKGLTIDLMPDQVKTSELASKTIKAGPVTISKEFTGGGESSEPHFSTVERLLRPFIRPYGEFERA